MSSDRVASSVAFTKTRQMIFCVCIQYPDSCLGHVHFGGQPNGEGNVHGWSQTGLLVYKSEVQLLTFNVGKYVN